MGRKNLSIAAIILLATWGLAQGAKWMFARMVDQIGFFRRGTSSGESVGMALGKIVSLLIWLIGLLIVLQQLGFNSVITPGRRIAGKLYRLSRQYRFCRCDFLPRYH